MIKIALVFAAGIALIAGLSFAFYFTVGVGLPLSNAGDDWAAFGSYFGGVAGALFSFLSVLLIVFTLHQQGQQIEAAQDDAQRLKLLEYVSKADEEVERWLRRRLMSRQGREVEFGDVVWGIVKPDYVESQEFSAALSRLHKLTCAYCAALALYEDNVDPYFIFGLHRQKADELLDFLESHTSQLGQMAGPSLAICRAHLRGEEHA